MKQEVEAVFLFIAELSGSFVPGTGTMADKIECGRLDYVNNHLPSLDLSTDKGIKDAHEVIWLERLYKDLDNYFDINNKFGSIEVARGVCSRIGFRIKSYKWTVPVEIDMSASVMVYVGGLLLGDKRILEIANVHIPNKQDVMDTELHDPWDVIHGLPRNHVKRGATPMMYGGSQPVADYWVDNNLEYDDDQIAIFNREMLKGPFGLINDFKDIIINNVKPASKMRVKVFKESFDVYCNKYLSRGDHAYKYKVWDSKDEQYNVVEHWTTQKIPDLEAFKRYFMTLPIHNLDSQGENLLCEKVIEKYGWAIPIHDATILSPRAVVDARQWNCDWMAKVYFNRKTILKDYCNSVGIPYDMIKELVANKVQSLEEPFNPNPMVLK